MNRPVKEVCAKCKRLLKKAKWMEEELSRKENETVIWYGARPHWNEYIFSHTGIGHEILEHLFQIVEYGSRPLSVHEPATIKPLGKLETQARYAIMDKNLARAIKSLRELIAEALKKEYEQGKKDGENLLIRLHNGDISINEFYERLT